MARSEKQVNVERSRFIRKVFFVIKQKIYAPEAEGELEEVLQGQEVHPIGPEAQEDPRHS